MSKKRRKRILQISLLFGTIVSLYFVPWIIIKAWLMPLPNTIQEQVDDALDYNFEGAIVYIDQHGTSPKFYAAGWHDRTDKIPANPKALFKIASIAKLYDAVALTKLVKDKRISLDKTLADYFPELTNRIENANEITIRMMVMHRSGIPNYTDHLGYWENPPNSRKANLELALDLPANFEPDKDYGYSNTNYLLLSQLMDTILGYDHFQFIKDEILTPLELYNTFGTLSEVNLDDVMSGYHIGYEPDLKTEVETMLATAEDLGNFIRALNDGSVFNDGEQDIYSSIYKFNHTGLIPGYQSIAKYHDDIDTVVIQFTNTTDFKGYNWNLSEIIYNRIVKIYRRNIDAK